MGWGFYQWMGGARMVPYKWVQQVKVLGVFLGF
jgi:hypothetical protein